MVSRSAAAAPDLAIDRAPGRVTMGAPPQPNPRATAGAPPPREAWLASQLADLTPEERATYDRGAFFHDLVDVVLEEEWNAPDRADRAREIEEKLRASYGGDADRELADLETGRHPLQQPR
jgi:hypothetical protein